VISLSVCREDGWEGEVHSFDEQMNWLKSKLEKAQSMN